MGRTLYISDLDGTLLRNDQTLSDFTKNTINSLTEKGVLFSYATARSYATSSIVAKGLSANIPVIVYNGTFILENGTGKELLKNSFRQDDAFYITDVLCKSGIYPIVYAFLDGKEKFSYIPHISTTAFLNTRRGDGRDRPVSDIFELKTGEIFHFSCIDTEEKLFPLYQKFKNDYTCVYYREMYSGDMWLEIQPKSATKANAVKKLKELLGCEKVVCFGDGKNDISMFLTADECYAVDNAEDELKAIATAVISSNQDDGVAKWLSENAILPHYY